MDPLERAKRVRGMESLPAGACASAAVILMFALMAHGAGWANLITLLFGVGWLWLVVAYRRRYRYVMGATRLLVLFHVVSALWVVGSGIALMGCMVVTSPFSPSRGVGSTVLLVGVGMLAAGGWLYVRARAILGRMHDQLTELAIRDDAA
jgi:hypothetical protein